LDDFQFDDNGVLDEEVGDVFAADDVLVANGHALLLRDVEAEQAQFSGEGVFADFLQKSGSERIGDFGRGTDDALGQRVQPLAILVHPVHPCEIPFRLRDMNGAG
jgi:hypothetical protein